MNAPVRTYANPFLATTRPTLADVLDRIQNSTLSQTRKRDCISGIKRFSELTQKPTSAILADPVSLRAELDAASAALAKLTDKTGANIRSCVLTACEASGLCRILRTGKTPLLPEWFELFRGVPDGRTRDGLSRASRFWSLNGITPSTVDATALAAFSQALEASQLAPDAPAIVRNTATLWNRLAAAQPERNLSTIELVSRRAPSTRVEFAVLPLSFREDLEAYDGWASGHNLVSDDGPKKPLAARTLILRRQQIRSIVTAMVASGTPPEAISSLDALVVPSAAQAVLRHRYELVGRAANAYNEGLAKMLISLAKDWVEVDAPVLAELKRLQSKLPKLRAGLTEKNKALLRHFNDPETLSRFYAVPSAVLDKLDARILSLTTLAQYQAALAIAILLYAPLRIANLAALELGAKISLPARDDQETRLEIPAHETKNQRPYLVMLPPTLTKFLRMYERDCLQPLGTKLLFDNGKGASELETTLSGLIERTIQRHMGFKMTAQQFRHLAAKIILDAEPGSHPLISELLGHKNLKTAMMFYAELSTQRAARHHAMLLEAAVARSRATMPLRRKNSVVMTKAPQLRGASTLKKGTN